MAAAVRKNKVRANTPSIKVTVHRQGGQGRRAGSEAPRSKRVSIVKENQSELYLNALTKHPK